MGVTPATSGHIVLAKASRLACLCSKWPGHEIIPPAWKEKRTGILVDGLVTTSQVTVLNTTRLKQAESVLAAEDSEPENSYLFERRLASFSGVLKTY